MARSLIIYFLLICLKQSVFTKSIPDCPNNEGHSSFVLYDGSPSKCYLIGQKGPCGIGQKLLRDQESRYGICNCECFSNSNFDSSKLQFCKDDELEEYVYHPVWRKCFRLGDQGPCKADEWLVKSSRNNGDPIFCEKKVSTGKIIRKRDVNENSTNPDIDGRYASASINPSPCPSRQVWSSLFNTCMARRTPAPGIGR